VSAPFVLDGSVTMAWFFADEATPAVDVDPKAESQAASAAYGLARSHRLTLYDAAYLELAMRASLPLATLDTELRTVAKKAGVKCLPERI
jgi:predicted nucleic acid-binding protein